MGVALRKLATKIVAMLTCGWALSFSALAQADHFSEEALWIRQALPVLQFQISIFEPIDASIGSGMAASQGLISRDEAADAVEQASAQLELILSDLEWSLELLPPAPAPSSRSPKGASIISYVEDLSSTISDLKSASTNLVDLVDQAVQQENWDMFRAAGHQYVTMGDQMTVIINRFHEAQSYGDSDDSDFADCRNVVYKSADMLAMQSFQLHVGLLTEMNQTEMAKRRAEFSTELRPFKQRAASCLNLVNDFINNEKIPSYAKPLSYEQDAILGDYYKFTVFAGHHEAFFDAAMGYEANPAKMQAAFLNLIRLSTVSDQEWADAQKTNRKPNLDEDNALIDLHQFENTALGDEL